MMKNSKLRRILLLLACAVLLVSLSVGATLAYLTSTTQTVKNTFTVGSVNIILDEAVVNTETGKASDPENRTEKGNEKVLMVPGRLIDKDPTVTVLANSEDCYVRVKVTVDVSTSWQKPTDSSTDTFEKWAGSFGTNYVCYKNGDKTAPGFNVVKWRGNGNPGNPVVNVDDRTLTYYFYYWDYETDNIVKKSSSDNELEEVFAHIRVPDALDGTDLAKLEGMKINVVAEAIQAEGFEDEAAAWEAFDNQNK